MADFEDQIRACLPDLWRYAYSLTRNRDQADDLVQDCAERALKKRHLWDPSGSLRGWLATILLNIRRNQLRSGLVRKPAEPLDALPFEPAATETLSGRLDLQDTLRALARLPEEQRDALTIVVLAGLSYKEAADTLDIPVGTLMSRISRARAGLRQATGQTDAAQKETAQ